MTTDRLFVIMLVILIPMTGCFGAVGDAEADKDDDSNDVEMITVGGMFNESQLTLSDDYYYLDSFKTYPGQLVEIHYFNGYDIEFLQIYTSCDDGSSDTIYTSNYETYAYGSHTTCTHTIEVREANVFEQLFGFSLVYSIEEITNRSPTWY